MDFHTSYSEALLCLYSGVSLQRNKHHCDNPPGIMQLPLIKQVSAVFQGDYHFLFCSPRAQNKKEAATIK